MNTLKYLALPLLAASLVMTGCASRKPAANIESGTNPSSSTSVNTSGLSEDAALNAHANSKVALTGHTDERGTREYNMALGERRAKAVESYLITNGVNANQLEAVSYGKEMPVNAGHNEAAWKENRRVEINYEAVPPLLK